jgi:hypothetical protein
MKREHMTMKQHMEMMEEIRRNEKKPYPKVKRKKGLPK